MNKNNKPKIVPTLNRDAYDDFIFEGVEQSKKIRAIYKNESERNDTTDVFASFYKMTPEVNKQADRIRQDAFTNLMGMEEFKSLTAATQIDDVASGLATLDFAPKIIAKLKEIEEKKEEQQQQQKDAGQKPNPNPGLQDVLGEQGLGSFRQEMRQALSEAQDKADDWQNLKAGWGIDSGELKQVPYDKQLELAEKALNSKKFKNITDLVGRFKNIIAGSKTTVFSHGYDEIVDIAQGSDLGRMLPTEILKLKRSPKLFFKDFLEGKLLQYNLKQTEEMGKGPIIVCLDISGSMRGDREELAKAITLALIQMAEKERRSFGFMTFDYKVRQRHFWPKNERVPLEEKFKIASIISEGGGTNFQPPLETAIDFRNKEPDLKSSDIVFITDGECYLDEEFLTQFQEAKKKLDVKVFGIAVDVVGTSLNFCDHIAAVGADSSIEIVKDLIKQTSRGIK